LRAEDGEIVGILAENSSVSVENAVTLVFELIPGAASFM
jgi:acyl-CoA synthetase (AMP-forming)/AMP-acid ligase II